MGSNRVRTRAAVTGVAAFVLISAAGLSYYFLQRGRAAPPGQAVLDVSDPDGVLSGAMVALAPLTVNLGDTRSFLRLGVELEFFDFETPPDFTETLPKLKDAFVSILSAKSPEVLLRTKGKEALRTELLEASNNLLDQENQVVRVYFTEFVVQ